MVDSMKVTGLGAIRDNVASTRLVFLTCGSSSERTVSQISLSGGD